MVRSPVCQSPSHAEATAVSHGAQLQLHRPPAGTRRSSPTHFYSFLCTYFLSVLSFPSQGGYPVTVIHC